MKLSELFLAKYEPASKIGDYKWDYKYHNTAKELNLLNRYLIERESLNGFIDLVYYQFYIITPIEKDNKIQNLLYEKQLQKRKFTKLNYLYVRDEKLYSYYQPVEVRTIKYFYKKTEPKESTNWSGELFEGDTESYILFSKKEINEGTIIEFLEQKNQEVNRYSTPSDEVFNFLIRNNLALVYNHISFFHEECSHLRQRNSEEVFICYSPFRIT